MQRSNLKKKSQTVVPRPPDDLPPEQLQAAWEKYLNYEMGHPEHRPNFEVQASPKELTFLAEQLPQDYQRLQPSPRMKLLIQALHNCLPKLSLMQQLAIKKYYGIDKQTKSQEEIAEELGLSSQRMAAKYIERAKKQLKLLIRKELSRLVKASVQKQADQPAN